MFDGLFQPTHFLWPVIIVLMIMWSWEAWRHWYRTRNEHNKFKKNHVPAVSTIHRQQLVT
jgi:hypothetical protein